MIITRHQLTMISQHQAAARKYLEAYKVQPDNPLINFCAGTCLINLALGFRVQNRNQCLVQGFAFLHNNLRLCQNNQSMGVWMDQKLRIADFYLAKTPDSELSHDSHSALNGEEGTAIDYELHAEATSEVSETATLEQRRAYKLEFQGCGRYVPWDGHQMTNERMKIQEGKYNGSLPTCQRIFTHDRLGL